MNVNQYDFVYCPQCDSKPGAPTLCNSCLTNRKTISELKAAVERFQRTICIIGDVVKFASEIR